MPSARVRHSDGSESDVKGKHGSLKSRVCWECHGTGLCDCITCQGKCVVCPAIEKMNRLRPYLDARGIDPRDAKYWRLFRPEVGPSFKRFTPEADFDRQIGAMHD
jgi:hypothetical protein